MQQEICENPPDVKTGSGDAVLIDYTTKKRMAENGEMWYHNNKSSKHLWCRIKPDNRESVCRCSPPLPCGGAPAQACHWPKAGKVRGT